MRAACGRGLRKPANWMQLVKFSVVGASGYVVNLAVFSTLVKRGRRPLHPGGRARLLRRGHQQLPAGTGTGRSGRRDGHAGFQAARFLTVSLIALGFNLIVLELLVSVAGVEKIPAQAIAILAATPLNFVGNKLWSFGDAAGPRTPRRTAA